MDSANSYYGHKEVFARYCRVGLTSVPCIEGYLQHGWSPYHGFGFNRDIYPDFRKFFWSERVLCEAQKLGWTNCIAIGSPWAYMLKDPELEPIPEKRSGVLLYPFHGWEGGVVTGSHQDLIDHVNAIETEPVTVCLYWLEYETPEIRSLYESAGYRVICHGYRGGGDRPGTKRFLYCQYEEIIKHRRVISNRLSTAVMYAASLGCDVAVYGDPMVINDPGLARNQGGDAHSKVLFSEFYGAKTDVDVTTYIARCELGFDIVQTVDKLKEVFGWGCLVECAKEGSVSSDSVSAFSELFQQDNEVLFSIILTTYNRPDLLRDALASVASQTLRDFEVILINDNGEPVEHLLANYDFPITYICQGRNRGLSAARNAGLAVARGRYVVYLDDDDIYLPNHLAMLTEAFEQHPGCVIYTGVEYVNEKLEDGQRIELGRGQPFKHEAFDRDRLFVQNYIPVNTWAHLREMTATVGGFDIGLAAFEDWDMLLRLATRYPFVHVPVVTSEVHMREQSNSGDHMLGRERKNFPALYQLLYRRYPGSDSEVLKRERGDMLQRLGISVDECADVPTLQRWLAERLPTEPENRLINRYLQEHDGGPLIGILVLDIDGQSPLLMQTLKSLIGERCLYATLKIVVLTSGGDVPKTSAGDKLHFVRLSDEHLASQINRVVNENDFSWFMLARAGDEFTPSGLMVAGLELAVNPECRAIYGDQLQRLPDGSLGGAFLPSFNLDLLLSFPLVMARHWLFRRDVFLAVGGFDAQFAEALELELLLRLIETQGLLGLGHVDEPLLIIDAPALRDNQDERRVIERHLARRGYQARVVPGLPARYRIDYGHSSKPLVSIIIAIDAPLASLQRCLDSLLDKTRYEHYEILLGAHDGLDADTQAWLQGIASLADARLRVVSADDIVLAQNQAAMIAQGEYLLLLSGESVAVSEVWLDELLNHAQRPEVGVVGGKLLSGDGRINQAGLLLGLRGPAGRAFAGEAMDSAGYLQRLQVDQNYSAVSDACLMVRADIFRQLGGLDATLSAYRDVDFCLRVRAAGYLTVWAAHAVLMHEHVYREPDVAEQDALYERHLADIARDPAYKIGRAHV